MPCRAGRAGRRAALPDAPTTTTTPAARRRCGAIPDARWARHASVSHVRRRAAADPEQRRVGLRSALARDSRISGTARECREWVSAGITSPQATDVIEMIRVPVANVATSPSRHRRHPRLVSMLPHVPPLNAQRSEPTRFPPLPRQPERRAFQLPGIRLLRRGHERPAFQPTRFPPLSRPFEQPAFRRPLVGSALPARDKSGPPDYQLPVTHRPQPTNVMEMIRGVAGGAAVLRGGHHSAPLSRPARRNAGAWRRIRP